MHKYGDVIVPSGLSNPTADWQPTTDNWPPPAACYPLPAACCLLSAARSPLIPGIGRHSPYTVSAPTAAPKAKERSICSAWNTFRQDIELEVGFTSEA